MRASVACDSYAASITAITSRASRADDGGSFPDRNASTALTRRSPVASTFMSLGPRPARGPRADLRPGEPAEPVVDLEAGGLGPLDPYLCVGPAAVRRAERRPFAIRAQLEVASAALADAVDRDEAEASSAELERQDLHWVSAGIGVEPRGAARADRARELAEGLDQEIDQAHAPLEKRPARHLGTPRGRLVPGGPRSARFHKYRTCQSGEAAKLSGVECRFLLQRKLSSVVQRTGEACGLASPPRPLAFCHAARGAAVSPDQAGHRAFPFRVSLWVGKRR